MVARQVWSGASSSGGAGSIRVGKPGSGEPPRLRRLLELVQIAGFEEHQPEGERLLDRAELERDLGRIGDRDVGRPAPLRDLERFDDEDEPFPCARIALAPAELDALRLRGPDRLHLFELAAAAAAGEQQHCCENQWPAHRLNLRS